MESKALALGKQAKAEALNSNVHQFFWFPRAFVRTHSGRASVQSLWVTRRRRVAKAFPRQRVNAIELRILIGVTTRDYPLQNQWIT